MDLCEAIVELDDKVLATPEKWTKGNWVDSKGRMCLSGACMDVTGGLSLSRSYDSALYHQMSQALVLVIKQETSYFLSLVNFNDASETTFEDVKRVIKKTRAKVCGEE